MAVGTTTLTYPSEVFTVNGMTLSSSITKNYFWNFVGLTIFLFGIGGLLSYIEIRRKGMRA